LEKGGKYMQEYKATIDRKDDQSVDLVLTTDSAKHTICLTDDNPNEVKKVFNSLIVELKKGKFTFSLSDETKDLFFYVCDEYLKQLNGEIADVYSQLKKHKLVDKVE
jgi:uncharacterized protein (DUF1015 family)